MVRGEKKKGDTRSEEEIRKHHGGLRSFRKPFDRRVHLDHGINLRRSVFVDGSGASGAPFAIAIADRFTVDEGVPAALVETMSLSLPFPVHAGRCRQLTQAYRW